MSIDDESVEEKNNNSNKDRGSVWAQEDFFSTSPLSISVLTEDVGKHNLNTSIMKSSETSCCINENESLWVIFAVLLGCVVEF